MDVTEIEIDFQKSEVGLGFNIVGGSDVPHLPIDCGIFVTKILPDGPAAKDGRLQNGDKIVSINGASLEKVTHSEAVSMFRNSGPNVKLRVQQGAERALKAKIEGTNSPKAASPKAASPKATSPKATSPKAASPKAASPKAPSPKATSPKAIAKESPSKDFRKDNIPTNVTASKSPVLRRANDKTAKLSSVKSQTPKTQDVKPSEKSVNMPACPKENKLQEVKDPIITSNKPSTLSDNNAQANNINLGPSQKETRAETAEAKKENDPLWQHITTMSVVIGLLGLGVAMYFIVKKSWKTI